MEEIILHAGYYDDNPRAREIVWIMLAQRCARGLASLYAQANQFDLQQAKAFQVEWTPRGWMRPDLDLLGFEQQLYLRQPGYGTSYVTGKSLVDELIKDRAHQLGDGFTLRRFFDDFNAAGMMLSLIHIWSLPRSSSCCTCSSRCRLRARSASSSRCCRYSTSLNCCSERSRCATLNSSASIRSVMAAAPRHGLSLIHI